MSILAIFKQIEFESLIIVTVVSIVVLYATITENPTSHMHEDVKRSSIFKASVERIGL